MFALVTAVLIASLLGSLHCAGMCGPFVAFAVNDSEGASKTGLQLAYHLGRLTTYMLLGAAAGATGALVDLTSTLAGLQPVAMALAGGLMVTFGALELARVAGLRLAHTRPPQWLTKTVQAGPAVRPYSASHASRAGHRAAHHAAPLRLVVCLCDHRRRDRSPPLGGDRHGRLLGWHTAGADRVGRWRADRPGDAGAEAAGSCAPIMLIAVGLWTLAGRAALDPSTLAHAAAPSSAAGTDSAVPDPSELPPCCRENLESENRQEPRNRSRPRP